MLFLVAAVNIHHHIADDIFWSIEFIVSQCENEVPFKLVLGGVAGVAHFITGHEQTQ